MTLPGTGSVRGGWKGAGRGPARVEVRSRIALVAAAAVALAVVLVAVSAYVAVRGDLLGGVDQSLTRTAVLLEHERTSRELARAFETISVPSTAPEQTLVPTGQVVGTNGTVVAQTRGASPLPFTPDVRAVAEGRGTGFVVDATASGAPVRLLVRPFGHGLALELASRIGGVDAELRRLADVLLLAAAGGVVMALLLGAGVSGLALRPVRRLTAAAEEVAATQDLSRRLPVEGRDELSRLATSINALLGAVERAEVSQRQLVADASHELRTPLASLRTNVELLAGADAGALVSELRPLDAETRRQLADDVVRQFDRVGTLVGDLVELARQDRTAVVRPELVDLDLAALVAESLEDEAGDHPSVRIESSLAPARVRGIREDLVRLLANLVGNAAKWSPAGSTVEVLLETGPPVRLVVSDRGAGIEPEDLAHVFDRFYRGRSSGGVPGSGLGLAIVRRIVEVHGGRVSIESTPGAGTRVEVLLPAGDTS
ncbi:MAG: HAMP domain-containing sensor histidine kinase [Actinomycetota bacterium]|nr:HAMP domain-containing sensor histidine kinase [Actinomycetota bacterium]